LVYKEKKLSTDEIAIPERKEDINDISRNTLYANRKGSVIRKKPTTANMISSKI